MDYEKSYKESAFGVVNFAYKAGLISLHVRDMLQTEYKLLTQARWEMKKMKEQLELKIEHSNEKTISIEEIIECVFEMCLQDIADSLNKNQVEVMKCG